MNTLSQNFYSWVLLVICLLASGVEVSGQEKKSAPSGKLEDLEKVDWTSRPDPEGRKTVVELSVKLLDIDEIDGASQTFTANVVVLARWKDTRLVSGSKLRTLPLTEVWNPVLQITNQQKLFRTFPDVVQVDAEGNVEWVQRYWGKFSNPLTLHDFPLDEHTFVIQLVVASMDFKDVGLLEFKDEENRSGLAEKLSLPDWEVTDWRVKVGAVELIEGSPALPGLAFEFDASRYIGYYLTKVLLPLLMIVMMSWIVFWINPSQSATQISVAITSMLTLIAYRFALGSMLPDVSYVTRMDGFILIASVMVFVALLEAVWTSRLVDEGKAEMAMKIDHICQRAFPAVFVTLCIYAAWG
ncbi:MAG: hypothetical protein QM496_01410 [Verrucomicrobiota bacterium]